MVLSACLLPLLFIPSHSLGIDVGSSGPQFRKPVNCKNLSDGNYVYGCSRFYSMCTNGREHPTHCYENLVLDPESNQCEEAKNVPICQLIGDTRLYRSKDPFTCVGKPSGNYEAGVCAPAYIQCQGGGRRLDMPCPPGLVYSAKANGCDWADACLKTVKKKKPGEGVVVVDQQATGQQVSPASMASANYSSGGATRRGGRRGGYTIAANQPLDVVLEDSFNAAAPEQLPVYPSSAYGSPAPSPPAPATPSYNYNNAQPPSPSPSPAASSSSPPAPSFDCTGKHNGVYPSANGACSSQFWKCANNVSYHYTCPVGLFYNIDTNECDYRGSVVACGGSPPVPTTPLPPVSVVPLPIAPQQPPQPQSAQYLSYAVQQPQVPVVPVVPVQPQPVVPQPSYTTGYSSASQAPTPAPQPSTPSSPLTCAGKADGVYVSGCSASFWKCVNKQPYQYSCPPGLFYNIDNNQCDYKPNIVACGGHPTTPPPPSQLVSTPSPPPLQQQQFACGGKSDGNYASQPCTASFYTCAGGVGYSQRCAAGTVFDPQIAACDYPDACGKPRPTTPPPTPAPPPQSYAQAHTASVYDHGGASYYFGKQEIAPQPPVKLPYGKPSQQPPTTPISTSKQLGFSCIGLPDGFYYKEPCAPTFVTCSADQVSQHSCPAGLLFDHTAAVCVYPDTCGKPKNITTTTASPPPTVNGYNQAPSTTTPKPAFDCTGKSDGYYQQQPCTASFFTCSSGYTTQVNCPPNLVFDSNTGVCEYPSLCGKPTPPPTSAPPPSPPTPSTYYQAPPPPTATPTPYSNSYVPQAPNPSPVISPQPPRQVPVDFDCVGKPDGYYYKQPCQTNFYSCVSGQARVDSCQSGLVFDPVTGGCNYPAGCGKLQPKQPSPVAPPPSSPPPSAYPVPVPSPQYQPITAALVSAYPPPPSTPPPPPSTPPPPQQYPQPSPQSPPSSSNKPAFNCSGRQDGYYIKQPCTALFYTCNGGVLAHFGCPGDLVFDPKTGNCEYPSVCGKAQYEEVKPAKTC